MSKIHVQFTEKAFSVKTFMVPHCMLKGIGTGL